MERYCGREGVIREGTFTCFRVSGIVGIFNTPFIPLATATHPPSHPHKQTHTAVHPSGDLRVSFERPDGSGELSLSALSWIYNPLAVRPAGLVPFAPLTLRDASIGARVRVSADESVVVDLQGETPGWVPRMRATLNREGEIVGVDRAPGGRGVSVRMDDSGDTWHFHPGGKRLIILWAAAPVMPSDLTSG